MTNAIRVQRLDHLVLTVADVDATCQFYERALGMEVVIFGEGRRALKFGSQKINLHRSGAEFEPKARTPTPGSGDLCFITTDSIEKVMAHLTNIGVEIEVGPVRRIGAQSALHSIYFRDPDGNLIEVANEVA